MRFIWEWCNQCDVWFIRCPQCGNNCCNGGCGRFESKDCDVCPLAYQFQAAMSQLYPVYRKEQKPPEDAEPTGGRDG